MYNNLDKEIMNICDYEYENFLNKANVVGIGYGYKYIKDIQTNEIVLQVFVENKVRLNTLHEKDRIPFLYKGIKTDVIETGICTISSLTERVRPVTGGYCIGPAGIFSCGTYGALVKDIDGYYILSNNHVIAVNNLVPIGNPILQPCVLYGGVSPNDVIGELSSFIPIRGKEGITVPVNYVDAAIAKVRNLSLVSPRITAIGVPKGIKTPFLSMNVEKVGMLTELTCGTIASINATVSIRYTPGESALFKKQIFFTAPTCKGDSGALVLSIDHYAVGLYFADNSKFSIANPINKVLTSLDVELVTDTNLYS